MLFFYGSRQIHGRQEGENQGLNEGNEKAQEKRSEGEQGKRIPLLNATRKNSHAEQNVLPADIAEKSKRQGKHPAEVRDDLHHEKTNGASAATGPMKCLDVSDAVGFDPHIVVKHEDDDGHGQRGVQHVRRRIEKGNQRHDVAKEDIDPQGRHEGEETPGFMPEHIVEKSYTFRR